MFTAEALDGNGVRISAVPFDPGSQADIQAYRHPLYWQAAYGDTAYWHGYRSGWRTQNVGIGSVLTLAPWELLELDGHLDIRAHIAAVAEPPTALMDRSYGLDHSLEPSEISVLVRPSGMFHRAVYQSVRRGPAQKPAPSLGDWKSALERTVRAAVTLSSIAAEPVDLDLLNATGSSGVRLTMIPGTPLIRVVSIDFAIAYYERGCFRMKPEEIRSRFTSVKELEFDGLMGRLAGSTPGPVAWYESRDGLAGQVQPSTLVIRYRGPEADYLESAAQDLLKTWASPSRPMRLQPVLSPTPIPTIDSPRLSIEVSDAFQEHPSPRLIRSWQDAELVAVEWLRHWGHIDATLTGAGSDGGVDVRSASLCVQVKAETVPVGRPALQRLTAVASHEDRKPVFFSLSGYSAPALEWAAVHEMALFKFDLQGVPAAANEVAAKLSSQGR